MAAETHAVGWVKVVRDHCVSCTNEYSPRFPWITGLQSSTQLSRSSISCSSCSLVILSTRMLETCGYDDFSRFFPLKLLGGADMCTHICRGCRYVHQHL